MDSFDLPTFWIFTTLLMVLTAATVVGQMLRRQTELGVNPAVVEQFNLRVRSWWMLTAMLAVGFLLGPSVTVALFGGLSFWALREFITLTPTRIADHRTLFWVFFVFTPLQFYLVATGQYEVYSILIPVYAFLFIPARIALAITGKLDLTGDLTLAPAVSMILPASARLSSMICAMRSSSVPAHTSLCTWMLWVWPIRWVRSVA